jgi:hypothetical protein
MTNDESIQGRNTKDHQVAKTADPTNTKAELSQNLVARKAARAVAAKVTKRGKSRVAEMG